MEDANLFTGDDDTITHTTDDKVVVHNATEYKTVAELSEEFATLFREHELRMIAIRKSADSVDSKQ